MAKKEKVISVYFLEEDVSNFGGLEIQVDEDTADSIMDRLEEHDKDKLFRINLDTLVNLNHVKAIKVEDVVEGEEYEDDEN